MRYFIHLAFGQPILATPGCEMLSRQQPFVTMCGSAADLLSTLVSLKDRGWDDGLSEQRWLAAKQNSWSQRAQRLLPAFLGTHAA